MMTLSSTRFYNYCRQMDDLWLARVTPSQSCWATIQYGAKSSRTMDYFRLRPIYPPEVYPAAIRGCLQQCQDCLRAESHVPGCPVQQPGLCPGPRAAKLFFNLRRPHRLDDDLFDLACLFTVNGVHDERVDESTPDGG